MSLIIPDELLQVSDMTEQELMQEIAIVLFKMEKISLGKAAEVSGVDRVSFQHLLARREIPVHYDVEDFEQDMETLQTRGQTQSEALQTMLASESVLRKDWDKPEEDAAWAHL